LIGADTTAKLIKMKILIIGMRGVGIETAKNLALQGVGGITVIHIISYFIFNTFGKLLFVIF
jgi:molybdopterin/thiamine biosynthesis adenylyltransferase